MDERIDDRLSPLRVANSISRAYRRNEQFQAAQNRMLQLIDTALDDMPRRCGKEE